MKKNVRKTQYDMSNTLAKNEFKKFKFVRYPIHSEHWNVDITKQNY